MLAALSKPWHPARAEFKKKKKREAKKVLLAFTESCGLPGEVYSQYDSSRVAQDQDL